MTIRVLGIDPGLASVGAAVIERDDNGALRWVAGEVIRTAPAKGKERRDTRVSSDDSRRYGEIWQGLTRLCEAHQPRSVAVEVYQPFSAGRGAHGHKTAIVYGLALSLAFAHGLIHLPFLPLDVKRGLVGKKSASKAEIQQAVTDLVDGSGPAFAQLAKTHREHLADAGALAVLGARELDQIGLALGIQR